MKMQDLKVGMEVAITFSSARLRFSTVLERAVRLEDGHKATITRLIGTKLVEVRDQYNNQKILRLPQVLCSWAEYEREVAHSKQVRAEREAQWAVWAQNRRMRWLPVVHFLKSRGVHVTEELLDGDYLRLSLDDLYKALPVDVI